jgi:hypothetical protein
MNSYIDNYLSLIFLGLYLLVALEICRMFLQYIHIKISKTKNQKFDSSMDMNFVYVSLLFYSSWVITRISPYFGKIIILIFIIFAILYFLRVGKKFSFFGLDSKQFIYLYIVHIALISLNYIWATNLTGFENMQARTTFPVDNVIPSEVARYITESNDRANIFGNWKTSDRPPLSVGSIFLLRDFLPFLNYHDRDFLILVSIQFLFLVSIFHFIRIVFLSERTLKYAFLLTALSGMVILNYAFTWPKLLAAAFTLMALSSVFRRNSLKIKKLDVEYFLESISWRTLILLISALLFHGAEVFAVLIYFTFYVIFALKKRKSVRFYFPIIFAICFYMPWYLFQKFIVPSYDRLLKYHLAGDQDPSTSSFLKIFFDSYRDIDLNGFIQSKVQNLETMLGAKSEIFFQSLVPAFTANAAFENLGYLILNSFSGLYLPLILVLLFSKFLKITPRSFLHFPLILAFPIALSYLFWITVMFDGGSAITIVGPSSNLIILKVLFVFVLLDALAEKRFLTLLVVTYLIIVNSSYFFYQLGTNSSLEFRLLPLLITLISIVFLLFAPLKTSQITQSERSQ